MRCPDCSKFVSLECADPEVESLEVEQSGDGRTFTIRASVHCVRQCADCGTDLKETTFEVEAEGEAPAETLTQDHPEHEFEVEETGVESTEDGGGRYKANLIGFTLDYKVTCAGCSFEYEGQVADKSRASEWDEMA